MTDYYISPTGTNVTTAGTLANPWATLAYACSRITAGSHTIHASAGTFNEVAGSVVPLGVSIIGSGKDTTIFKWTGVTSPDYLIKAETSAGGIGNHTFSDFTIDGNNRTLTGGIRVMGRSGLTLQNVNFINCSYAGATILASYTTTETTPPAFYLTDVLIADCDFTNCSRINGSSSSGVLELSGLDGAEVRNITVNEDTGWGIKFVANGWFKRTTVHDCEITCPNTDPTYQWAASLELWNLSDDCRVYRVNCNTWFSFCRGNKGGGIWALQVHDCQIINTKSDTQYIVPFELAELSDVEVFRNYMENPGTFGIGGFWEPTPCSNIHIHHNICKGGSNLGNTFIRISPDPGITVSDFYIYNNVVDGNERAINLIAASGFINNVQIKNNIFFNLSLAGILITSASSSNIVIESNCFFGVSTPLDNQGGTNVTYQNNLTTNPLFVASGNAPDPYYRLQSESPLINAGIDVGLGYLGTDPDMGAFEFFEFTYINFAMKSSYELEATGLHLLATARKSRAEVLADAAGVTLTLPVVPDLEDLQRDWQKASATYTGLLGQIEEAVATLPAGGGGVSTFVELDDTPASITASQFLRGNSGGTALEFGMPTAAQVGAEPTITILGVTKGGTGLGTIASGNILYSSASNTLAATAITTFGRTLINTADATAGRTALGAEPTITILPVSKGGTGLGSVTASQFLRGNSGGTAFEFTALSGSDINVTASDATAPTTLGPGTLTQWFGWVANRTKAITGATNWWDTPATTLATTATHIANTSNPHSTTAAQVGAIPTTEKAAANGVATLDATTRIPIEQIPQALIGAVVYQGAWNPSTNTPTLTSSAGTKGHYYVCSTTGTTSLNGISDWNTSDVAIFNGATWEKIDARDAVTSVNGQVGSVSLTAANVGAEPVITTLPITKGGTGLSSIAADNILYTSASNTLAATAITAFGRSLIDDVNATAALTTLGAEPAITTLPVTKGGTGLGTIAAGNILYTSASNTLAATVITAFIRGLLDDADAATARATLGANDAANLTAGILAAARLPLADAANKGAISSFSSGTWTPTLEASVTPGTHTYSVQVGNYLKFDTFCVAPFYINISSKDAAMAGNGQIGGLPFAAKNSAGFFQSILFSQFNNITFSAGYTQLGGRLDPNTSKVLLIQNGSGIAGNVITSANIGGTCSFIGCVLYFTN